MTLDEKQSYINDYRKNNTSDVLYCDSLFSMGIIDASTRDKLRNIRGKEISFDFSSNKGILYINLIYKIIKDHNDNRRKGNVA